MGASSIALPNEARPLADLSRSQLIFAVAGMDAHAAYRGCA